MARSSAPIELMNKSSINCSLTKMTSISVQNWPSEKVFIISQDRTVLLTERHLTKSCGSAYNQTSNLSRDFAHITIESFANRFASPVMSMRPSYALKEMKDEFDLELTSHKLKPENDEC